MATKVMVKCMTCGESFDRNSEDCIRYKRRYIHMDCVDTEKILNWEELIYDPSDPTKKYPEPVVKEEEKEEKPKKEKKPPKHIVKCKYCGKEFDANQEEHVVKNRRYAHKRCYEGRSPELIEQENFFDLAKNYLGSTYDYLRVRNQATEYTDPKGPYHMSWSGMSKTLHYWYEVLGKGNEKSGGGIGIIPHVYNKALQYEYKKYVTQCKNEGKSYQPYNEVIEINKPTARAQKRPFSVDMFALDENYTNTEIRYDEYGNQNINIQHFDFPIEEEEDFGNFDDILY